MKCTHTSTVVFTICFVILHSCYVCSLQVAAFQNLISIIIRWLSLVSRCTNPTCYFLHSVPKSVTPQIQPKGTNYYMCSTCTVAFVVGIYVLIAWHCYVFTEVSVWHTCHVQHFFCIMHVWLIGYCYSLFFVIVLPLPMATPFSPLAQVLAVYSCVQISCFAMFFVIV